MPKTTKIEPASNLTGIAIACFIIVAWIGMTFYCLTSALATQNPTYGLIASLVITHLYTGLFITAHDAMHNVVAPARPKINHSIGRVCAFFFAFNSYDGLKSKHVEHHRFVGTEKDPDYHNGNPKFWAWYFDFAKEYISWKQIVLMGITYNILKWVLLIPESNIIMFWMLPSLLSTLQLFYFGTYQPHKGYFADNDIHKSRSQGKNHLVSFLSCYFFGYHHEHHALPNTPWWLLWKAKEVFNSQNKAPLFDASKASHRP